MTTPSATPTLLVEMECDIQLLDPDSNVIQDPDGQDIMVLGWGDVTEDIRQTVPISLTSGNSGHEITDRAADVGNLTLAFDNSEANSAGLKGYYSPDSGNCREFFQQDTPIRVSLTNAGTAYYEQYYMQKITPSMGPYRNRITMVSAADYLHYLQETPLEAVAVQASKRDDQLIPLLTALASRPPEATDYDAGDDTYTYAFHDEQSGSSSLARIIQKLMMSGLGKFYRRGGTTSGETLTYISRTGALLATTPVATLDNTMTELSISRDDTSRVKKVIVTAYPAQTDTSNVVMWQLNKSIPLTAGQTATFTMRLRDPSGRANRVAAYSTLAPVADTDFKFSSVDGSGNDKNANLVISYGPGADAIDVTVTNTAAVTAYLWFFQPRGKLIYLYEPIPVVGLTGQTAGRTMEINMWYQDDPFVALDVSTVVSTWYSVPISNINSVTFCANANSTLMQYALSVQPGDLVLIKEYQTGVDSAFFVNGRKLEIKSGGMDIRCTWTLTPGNQLLNVFILDQSALDVNALGA